LTSRSALEGERKQVTVLFADVKGSMDLSEQVDPEEWHKIMDRFFAILSEGVHRFEGTVKLASVPRLTRAAHRPERNAGSGALGN
jgi:class 3 adenylate cyclase